MQNMQNQQQDQQSMQQQGQMGATQLKDKDMLEDMLTLEKHIAGVYNTGVTEASCQNLRQVLTANMEETLQDQFSTFNEMYQRGFYQVKQANPQDVSTAQQKYQQMQSQMN